MFMRNPMSGAHSVERVFDSVRQHLPADILCQTRMCSRTSQGLWQRVWITVEAAFRQADVNHVTGDVQFLTTFMRRRRTVLTVLDLVTVERLRGFHRWLYFLLWFRIPIARARVVTTISSYTREHLLRELGSAKADVRVVHCQLMDGYVATPRVFNTSRPVILMVGLAHNKNFFRSVEALAGIACELRIIGRLDERHLKTLAESGLAHTNCSGLTDAQIRDEYVSCDMLVFASTAEGFGLPILEAQAIGRPVVTSNVTSMPEVAGDAAEFVDPFDVDSIRAGVLRVIQDERHRTELITRGFENVKRFSPRAIAERYAAIYREVAGVGAGRQSGSSVS
jgi:glycosyltransferase involved in cell wall biosynthesis